jgi:hypothetical protein
MKSQSPPAITTTGLRRSVGDKVVLDGISLQVPEGTIFALLGHNGAGEPRPDAGADLLGEDLVALRPARASSWLASSCRAVDVRAYPILIGRCARGSGTAASSGPGFHARPGSRSAGTGPRLPLVDLEVQPRPEVTAMTARATSRNSSRPKAAYSDTAWRTPPRRRSRPSDPTPPGSHGRAAVSDGVNDQGDAQQPGAVASSTSDATTGRRSRESSRASRGVLTRLRLAWDGPVVCGPVPSSLDAGP